MPAQILSELEKHRLSNPPAPSDPTEAARWDHTRLRRRLLDGAWAEDLRNRLQAHLGTVRREALGFLDMSSNPFRVICRELSALYLEPPDVHHELDTTGEVARVLLDSGLWSQQSRFQSWVIGCREYVHRIHVSQDGSVHFRPIPPDMITAEADPDKPHQPIVLRHLRPRVVPETGQELWAWDVLDISDPENPLYQVQLVEQTDAGEQTTDLSEVFLGGSQSGEAYPYRWSDGTPFIPAVLYHASRMGDRIWDTFEGVELVEGSLNLAVGNSFTFHCFKQAAHPQRWVMGCAPAGLGTEGGTEGNVDAARSAMVVDPTLVLALDRTEDFDGQPQVGQWSPAAQLDVMEATCSALASRLAVDAGVPMSDAQRQGGTARSGYAISLTNENKRQSARRFAGQFRPSDQELIGKTAALLNRFTGTNHPEHGWSVVYREVPLSPEELRSRRENVLELLREGLMSATTAYQTLNPGTSREQAQEALQIAARSRALFNMTSP